MKEYSLIKQGHVIANSSRRWGNKELPDEFIFNEESLHCYNELREKIKNQKEQFNKFIEEKKELYNLFLDDEHLFNIIFQNTKIEINPQNKFVFPDEFGEIFHELIYSLLIECFFNNPYNWNIIKSSKDLDFTITIQTNWSKVKYLFERLKQNKKQCFKEKNLFPFGKSLFNIWLDDKSRKSLLKKFTEKELRIFGKGSTNDADSKQEKENHCLELIKENLENLENDYKSFKYAFKKFNLDIRKKNLEKLKEEIKTGKITPKKLYTQIEWYPYIQKPYFQFRSIFLKSEAFQISDYYLLKKKYRIIEEKNFFDWLKNQKELN